YFFFFFQAEDGIRDFHVTGVQTCALPISAKGEGLGIELRPFDYTQTDTLAKNLEGIDQLLLISSSEVGQRKAQHENVINAAKTAGVKRIVYTSLLHADTSTISLAPEH